MKLATLLIDGSPRWGVIVADSFHDLTGTIAPDLRGALAAGLLTQLPALLDAATVRPLAHATWLPPIPNPDKIICVGVNYEDHRAETGRDVVPHPTLFTRFANTLVGHATPLIRPILSDKFDFEGELAIVIGKPAWRIDEADADAHVAGYTCFNDASVRDWQSHTTQFTPGKNFLATGALGPVIDTGFRPAAQHITTTLNGQVVQHAPLSDMIFSIARIIAYCAQFTRLEPGDIIATGTPGGVGARRVPRLWMKPGDSVEVAIDGLATLVNPVAGEG